MAGNPRAVAALVTLAAPPRIDSHSQCLRPLDHPCTYGAPDRRGSSRLVGTFDAEAASPGLPGLAVHAVVVGALVAVPTGEDRDPDVAGFPVAEHAGVDRRGGGGGVVGVNVRSPDLTLGRSDQVGLDALSDAVPELSEVTGAAGGARWSYRGGSAPRTVAARSGRKTPRSARNRRWERRASGPWLICGITRRPAAR